jgi:23S rRNA U2552 (ribose-2'-O)-methylase RlmE/FtsJ
MSLLSQNFQGIYKIIDTAIYQKINDLRTISAYAILTSAPEHQINIIHDETTEKSKISGIGDLSVEADFVISDGKGNYI